MGAPEPAPPGPAPVGADPAPTAQAVPPPSPFSSTAPAGGYPAIPTCAATDGAAAATPPPGAYTGGPPQQQGAPYGQPYGQSYGQPPPSAGAPPSAGYAPPYGPPGYVPPPGTPPPPGAVMLHLAPVPGIPMRTPVAPPQQGQVLLGYEVYQPRSGCCQCDGLNPVGLIAVIILILLFWPLAWVPCVLPQCFSAQQRPVYGWPVQPMAPPAGAPPAGQEQPAGGAAAPGYPPAPTT